MTTSLIPTTAREADLRARVERLADRAQVAEAALMLIAGALGETHIREQPTPADVVRWARAHAARAKRDVDSLEWQLASARRACSEAIAAMEMANVQRDRARAGCKRLREENDALRRADVGMLRDSLTIAQNMYDVARERADSLAQALETAAQERDQARSDLDALDRSHERDRRRLADLERMHERDTAALRAIGERVSVVVDEVHPDLIVRAVESWTRERARELWAARADLDRCRANVGHLSAGACGDLPLTHPPEHAETARSCGRLFLALLVLAFACGVLHLAGVI